MPLNSDAIDDIFAAAFADPIKPKRGDEIFAGTDYPRAWSGFIGQTQVKEQLQVQVASATARSTRIEHTLLASGIHGVGKTTLATLVAYQAGVGFLQTTGPLSVDEAEALMRTMRDHDILFIDEAHLLVQGGRNRGDWLLPFMTEGVLYTKRGPQQMPNIAIIAATTDAGVLPETLLSRFMVQPTIELYSPEESAQIVSNLADRMHLSLPFPADGERAKAIAMASDGNPRGMRRILSAYRDLALAFPDRTDLLAKSFEYAGVSSDGLTQVARDMLLVLATAPEFTASIDTIGAHLGEPGPLKHHEKQLLQRNLIAITGRGRKLTEAGLRRAHSEARTRIQS